MAHISDEAIEELRLAVDIVLTKFGYPKAAYLLVVADGYDWTHLSTFRHGETTRFLKEMLEELENHPENTKTVYRQ